MNKTLRSNIEWMIKNEEGISKKDYPMLLQAISYLKYSTAQEVIETALFDEDGIRRQIEEARADFEAEIAALDSEKTGILEENATLREELPSELNPTFKEKEIAKRKKKIEENEKRVEEIDSVRDSYVAAIEKLDGIDLSEKKEMVRQLLSVSTKKGMEDIFFLCARSLDPKTTIGEKPLFTQKEGEKGYSVDVEAFEEYLDVLSDPRSVSIAADYSRCQKRKEGCLRAVEREQSILDLGNEFFSSFETPQIDQLIEMYGKLGELERKAKEHEEKRTKLQKRLGIGKENPYQEEFDKILEEHQKKVEEDIEYAAADSKFKVLTFSVTDLESLKNPGLLLEMIEIVRYNIESRKGINPREDVAGKFFISDALKTRGSIREVHEKFATMQKENILLRKQEAIVAAEELAQAEVALTPEARELYERYPNEVIDFGRNYHRGENKDEVSAYGAIMMMGAMISNPEDRNEVVQMLGDKALAPQAILPERVKNEVARVEKSLNDAIVKAKAHVKNKGQDLDKTTYEK